MTCAFAYAGSDPAKLATLPRPAGYPTAEFIQPVVAGKYNHAAGRNQQLRWAAESGYDWVVLMDDDWLVDEFFPNLLEPGAINIGMLRNYPERGPYIFASVFIVPRQFMSRRWADHVFLESHFGDVDYIHNVCHDIPKFANVHQKFTHIPHPRRENLEMLARNQVLFEQRRDRVARGELIDLTR